MEDKFEDKVAEKKIGDKAIIERYCQSSYECGKAGMRHKIYYWTVLQLKQQLKELQEAGLLDEALLID